MDRDLKEKIMRIAIMALETGEGHLRTIEFNPFADEVKAIITRCNNELMNIVPDAEPGILMNQE